MGKGMPSRHPLILWKTGGNKENIEMEKKRLFLSGLLLLILAFASFSGNMDTPSEETAAFSSEDVWEPGLQEEPIVMCRIRITAGDAQLAGVLYDNPTARELAGMLPLTAELWHPAPGFARAFALPERIEAYGTLGYEYELGSLAYWSGGPSIAIIYKASREQTVVPVIPVGRITSDVSIFEGYGETVTVEIEEGEEIMER
jgi:hypothetical protein